MAITDSELREIYANAPVIKDTFEVIQISASWFTADYYLQNTFTEDIDVELDDLSIVTAQYAPMSLGRTSSNADLSYERTINIQQVNDIIAGEITNRDPESTELPLITSRGYVMYRDGSVSALKTAEISTQIIKTSRNGVGTNITSSAKPVNAQATGESMTATKFEMLKGYL